MSQDITTCPPGVKSLLAQAAALHILPAPCNDCVCITLCNKAVSQVSSQPFRPSS